MAHTKMFLGLTVLTVLNGLISLATVVGCGDATPAKVRGGDAGAGDGAVERSCTYKGKVYKDQQEWLDDCNTCKCNPEGTRGPGCSAMLCSDGGGGGSADGAEDSVSPLFTCGDELCVKGSQVCVNPCCGGAPPQCEPRPDSGTCPEGMIDGCLDGQDGCSYPPCTPPPPYCADPATLPAGCVREGPNAQGASCVCA